MSQGLSSYTHSQMAMSGNQLAQYQALANSQNLQNQGRYHAQQAAMGGLGMLLGGMYGGAGLGLGATSGESLRNCAPSSPPLTTRPRRSPLGFDSRWRFDSPFTQWKQWLVKTFFRLRISMRNKGWS